MSKEKDVKENKKIIISIYLPFDEFKNIDDALIKRDFLIEDFGFILNSSKLLGYGSGFGETDFAFEFDYISDENIKKILEEFDKILQRENINNAKIYLDLINEPEYSEFVESLLIKYPEFLKENYNLKDLIKENREKNIKNKKEKENRYLNKPRKIEYKVNIKKHEGSKDLKEVLDNIARNFSCHINLHEFLGIKENSFNIVSFYSSKEDSDKELISLYRVLKENNVKSAKINRKYLYPYNKNEDKEFLFFYKTQ